MKINREIIEILRRNKIAEDDGLTFLLSLYHDLKPTYIPNILKSKILASGILSPKDGQIFWNKPLFGEVVTHFEWVKEYRDSFKNINPERAGNLKTCVSRFQKYFAENPHIRVEDVKNAVNMYFRSVRDPQYLMKSHNFIYMGQAANRTSELEVWVERVMDIKESEVGRASLSNTMK